ncbi:MAG: 50S ribosomal protein L29 [Candidatus Vogelbacteria bacterium]|nr:50S ribosomal protein L29 [Candidatus Vogelbacteria bacterium]
MKQKITETNELELKKLLVEKRAEIANFKFGGAGGKVKNVKLSRNLRRQVAQILTKLNS